MITKDTQIDIQPTKTSRIAQVDFDNIAFGRVFSDHMAMMDFQDGKWQQPQIVPFKELSMNPATLVLHYGQAIFEGMKAFRGEDGKVRLFRADQNIKRFNRSAERMCMPQIPEELFEEMLIQLLTLDSDWVPKGESSSLYIRPFMYASDEYVGVKPSQGYKFIIFTCPVNAYYKGAVKVKVEKHFARSVSGGTGAAKAAGNYAGSLYPAKLAQEQGYDQLVWTDAKEHKYIEESGTMNIVFRSGNKIITPELSDTILAGVTRSSVLDLAKEMGYTVEERKVSVDEIQDLLEKGTLDEAFGAGTAATIAPIALIGIGDKDYSLSDASTWEFANKVSKALEDLKRGRKADTNGWITELP